MGYLMPIKHECICRTIQLTCYEFKFVRMKELCGLLIEGAVVDHLTKYLRLHYQKGGCNQYHLISCTPILHFFKISLKTVLI